MGTSRHHGHARLVTTFVAAHAMGVSARTLQRWAAAHLVRPADTSPSGRHLWRVEDLSTQIARSGLGQAS